jgi:hypothetical protein
MRHPNAVRQIGVRPQFTIALSFALLQACSTLGGQANATEWGPETNQIRLSIAVKGDQAEIKTNQTLILEVLIKNDSTNGMVFFASAGTNQNPDTDYLIVAPSGKSISIAATPLPEGAHGSASIIFAQARKTTYGELRFSDIYQLSEAGEYRIRAAINLGPLLGSNELPSNDNRAGCKVLSNVMILKTIRDH